MIHTVAPPNFEHPLTESGMLSKSYIKGIFKGCLSIKQKPIFTPKICIKKFPITPKTITPKYRVGLKVRVSVMVMVDRVITSFQFFRMRGFGVLGFGVTSCCNLQWPLSCISSDKYRYQTYLSKRRFALNSLLYNNN